LRSLFPRGNDVGFGLRFLRPRLGPGLRRDFVAATLEDLQRDLELLRLERSQVELPGEVDEVPFLLWQVHRLTDEIVVVPLRRRLQRRVADPIDVSPDRPRFLQVDVGQDRADVREAQGLQGPLVLDVLEDCGADRLVFPEFVRLDPVRGEGQGFVHVLDHLVEGLERDGAVPEHLVPRRGPASYASAAASDRPARSSAIPRVYQRPLSIGRISVAWPSASAAAGNCSSFRWRSPLPLHASTDSGEASTAASKAFSASPVFPRAAYASPVQVRATPSFGFAFRANSKQGIASAV